MSTKVSVLKYMSIFANDALEGRGILDLMSGKEIIDEQKYQENYFKYNTMMAGYFASGSEYHDKILYQKYISDIMSSNKTPNNFADLIELNKEKDISNELYKRSLKNSKFYNKTLIYFEMGTVCRSIVNKLSDVEKKEFEHAIYDMAYRYDEAFKKCKNESSNKIANNEVYSNVKVLKATKI